MNVQAVSVLEGVRVADFEVGGVELESVCDAGDEGFRGGCEAGTLEVRLHSFFGGDVRAKGAVDREILAG